MMNRRYGRMNCSTHLSSLGLVSVAIVIGLTSIILNHYAEGLLFGIAAILSYISIIWPYFESYSICNSSITVRKVFYSSEIIIPPKIIIVITQADVHSPFGHQSYFIKDALAVTILQEMAVSTALTLLRGKYPSQFIYTNGTIENSVTESEFVYSFIYNKEHLNQLLASTEYIIIPESIKDRFAVEEIEVPVYVDLGY